MRYILNDSSYIETISFNYQVECNNKSCIEYTGEVPTGYESLAEWSELANINAYKIVDGNLTFDSEEDTRLQELWASQQMSNNSDGDMFPIGTIVEYDGDTVPDGYEKIEDYSTNEVKIGTWIDGKPIYRKVLKGTTGASTGATLGNIQNLETLIDIRGVTGGSYKGGITWVNLNVSPQQFRQVYVNGGTVGMVQHTNEATPYIIILEYTKTTD